MHDRCSTLHVLRCHQLQQRLTLSVWHGLCWCDVQGLCVHHPAKGQPLPRQRQQQMRLVKVQASRVTWLGWLMTLS
jgi:hypothetical protein